MMKDELKAFIPDLYEWIPENESDFAYIYDESLGTVRANYERMVGIIEDRSSLPLFYIKKSHYKKKMPDLLKYINYFTKYYDLDMQVFFSILTVKYIVDTTPQLTKDEFIKIVIDRIVTDSFVAKCKSMANNLYKININSDDDNKYKSSPKINNDQARQICVASFAFRFLIPICLHFTNVNETIDQKNKTAYLETFSEVYNITINRIEKDDVKFINAVREFVAYRTNRLYKNNKTIFEQKKMLRGDTVETLTDDLIEDVIIVKTLYKLDYRQSCISFIDGVVSKSGTNYLREKYISKPYMIDSQETSKDSDDSMSHAEALEMMAYNRDESSIMVDEINRKLVMADLDRRFGAFGITDEEIGFYSENCKISEVTKFLLRHFYANIFKDSYAIDGMSRKQFIKLLIIMKRNFEISKMPLFAHICTSIIDGRYRENQIKNAKVIEELVSTNIWKDNISRKFKYALVMDSKSNPIFATLTGLLNSEYRLVEYGSDLNGEQIQSIDPNQIKNEYLLFLSII